MSAILSADDLNDFISPGVACIKPVETLPLQEPSTENAYEVTTEDKAAALEPPPAQISLTDCLACSGCVTSAEAVLVSLQSHSEVLSALDSAPMASPELLRSHQPSPHVRGGGLYTGPEESGKIFVASVSPQVRASIAATYGATDIEAGWMIEQLLSGTQGLGSGGKYGNRFTWVVDTNAMREVCLSTEAEDFGNFLTKNTGSKKPVLTSACPGWICYAEKTHPHVLPHLSSLKSPQALTGTLLKTVLSTKLDVRPNQIWHLAVMPCFDKKLEASRQELTDEHWRPPDQAQSNTLGSVRDVDCVITARELLMLAESRSVSFPLLPREAVEKPLTVSFPDEVIHNFLFSRRMNLTGSAGESALAGTSGGFLYHVLCTQKALHPGSEIHSERGRNTDVVDYKVVIGDKVIFKAARYYGFRNIQNLVRKLRPPKTSRMPGSKMGGPRKPTGAKVGSVENAYVEVMACPGGCTNGGGQIKLDDLGELQAFDRSIETQKDWLSAVDEAYYSMEESELEKFSYQPNPEPRDFVNGICSSDVKALLSHWSDITAIPVDILTRTTFRAVVSDVGKVKGAETEHVIEISSKEGGGW